MLEFDAALSTVVRAPTPARIGAPSEPATKSSGPLSADLLRQIHRYWNAANYLCVCLLYTSRCV